MQLSQHLSTYDHSKQLLEMLTIARAADTTESQPSLIQRVCNDPHLHSAVEPVLQACVKARILWLVLVESPVDHDLAAGTTLFVSVRRKGDSRFIAASAAELKAHEVSRARLHYHQMPHQYTLTYSGLS